jgi:UDP-galactopyranose mutase
MFNQARSRRDKWHLVAELYNIVIILKDLQAARREKDHIGNLIRNQIPFTMFDVLCSPREAALIIRQPLRSTAPAAPLRTQEAIASIFDNRSLVCLSHLRWDLVFQRPQHLMTRFAQTMPVYFVEEPHFEGAAAPSLARYDVGRNLIVLVPHLPSRMTDAEATSAQRELLAAFMFQNEVSHPVLWFYTPAALEFADRFPASVTVYDCMDELTAFEGASPELRRLETQLLKRADIVFTGGMSLYEAKHRQHPNVHAFPSAVDVEHFAQARHPKTDPADQRDIPHPRFGFFGVIDERLDRDLVAELARKRPEWQLILIGPVVKIDPESLPRAPNIHYLGRKPYDDLPLYIAGWDAALMPFARTAATRFISPTKTPEYLAAGKPVVSTPIVDVVRGWGHLDAVRIAATPDEFVRESENALRLAGGNPEWLAPVDRELANISWDQTWTRMAALIAAALECNAPGRNGQPEVAARQEAPPAPPGHLHHDMQEDAHV